MSDEPLNFEEHRRRRDRNAELVPCARCKKMILSTSVRCPECGIHFQGEAYDFAPPTGGSGSHTLIIVLAVLLLIAILLTLF
jgi:hypothetical protein